MIASEGSIFPFILSSSESMTRLTTFQRLVMFPKTVRHHSKRPRSEVPCISFFNGDCSLNRCPYSHDVTKRTPRKNKPCIQWRTTGRCKFGRACSFRHDQLQTIPVSKTLGEKVHVLEVSLLKPAGSSIYISQQRTIASYNWTSGFRPAIMVPGEFNPFLAIHG